jgi:hypothetical protein
MCQKSGVYYPEFDEHVVVFGHRAKACLQLLSVDAYFKHILKKWVWEHRDIMTNSAMSWGAHVDYKDWYHPRLKNAIA